MSDAVDIATENTEHATAIAIANRVRPGTALGGKDCKGCGFEIESERRHAVLGTEYCAECANYFAQHDRFKNGG